MSRFVSASIGGCVAEIFVLLIGMGFMAGPGDISVALFTWLVIFLSWPVLGYIAWRGGSPRAAVGRSFLMAGVLGLIAVPVFVVRFPGDRLFVFGIAVAASLLLILAVVLLRQPSWSVGIARFLDPEPVQRESRPARRSRLARATAVDDRPVEAYRKWAGLVVAVGGSAAGVALWSEPRNVPLLVASAVALLGGLRMLLTGRATSRRVWGVLAAGGIGGVLGFLPLLDLVSRRARGDVVTEYLSIAGQVGPYAAASGLLFGLLWPEWWWRWGLILSWGFVVAGVVSGGPLSRLPLLLVPIPCLAAAAGALIHRVVRMLSNRWAPRLSSTGVRGAIHPDAAGRKPRGD